MCTKDALLAFFSDGIGIGSLSSRKLYTLIGFSGVYWLGRLELLVGDLFWLVLLMHLLMVVLFYFKLSRALGQRYAFCLGYLLQ